MNERQFLQSLANRRVYRPRPLLDEATTARLLRGTTRKAQQLECAAQALVECLPAAWRGRLEADSFSAGRLVVRAADHAAAEWMRRNAARTVQRLEPLRVREINVFVRGSREHRPRGGAGRR